MYSKQDYLMENMDDIKDCLMSNTPISEIARKFKVKYDTLKRFLDKNNVEYKTNPNRKGMPHYESKRPAKFYFDNKIYIESKKLRVKLIEEGLKENRCEKCGRDEWEGGILPLELHHKDGNHYNNNFDNLQILCCNCHKQIHNYNAGVGEMVDPQH